MAELPNSNDLMHALQAYQTSWKNTYNYRGEVAERYINSKDEEIAELKRELEEEKRRRQEAEKEMENFKKHRKELLNLVLDIRCRHSGYYAPKNLLVDHLDKLTICATNLYESIPDIYEDRKFKNRYEGKSITDLCWKIKRAQYDINCRPNKPGIVTDSTVTPTRHSGVLIPRRDIIWDIKTKTKMGVRNVIERCRHNDSDSDSDSYSDSDSDSY